MLRIALFAFLLPTSAFSKPGITPRELAAQAKWDAEHEGQPLKINESVTEWRNAHIMNAFHNVWEEHEKFVDSTQKHYPDAVQYVQKHHVKQKEGAVQGKKISEGHLEVLAYRTIFLKEWKKGYPLLQTKLPKAEEHLKQAQMSLTTAMEKQADLFKAGEGALDMSPEAHFNENYKRLLIQCTTLKNQMQEKREKWLREAGASSSQ